MCPRHKRGVGGIVSDRFEAGYDRRSHLPRAVCRRLPRYANIGTRTNRKYHTAGSADTASTSGTFVTVTMRLPRPARNVTARRLARDRDLMAGARSCGVCVCVRARGASPFVAPRRRPDSSVCGEVPPPPPKWAQKSPTRLRRDPSIHRILILIIIMWCVRWLKLQRL